MGQCNHAVDVGVVIKLAGVRDLEGDPLCHGRRTVHRGDHRQVVPRAHVAVRAPVPVESRARCGDRLASGCHRSGGCLAGELAEGQVVRMHMLPGRNWLGGKTNDLTVLMHRLACPDRTKRDLVPGWYRVAASYRDANIVSGVQYQQAGLSRRCRCHRAPTVTIVLRSVPRPSACTVTLSPSSRVISLGGTRLVPVSSATPWAKDCAANSQLSSSLGVRRMALRCIASW